MAHMSDPWVGPPSAGSPRPPPPGTPPYTGTGPRDQSPYTQSGVTQGSRHLSLKIFLKYSVFQLVSFATKLINERNKGTCNVRTYSLQVIFAVK